MIPVTTTSILYWTWTGKYLLSLLVLYVETVAVPEMLHTQNVSLITLTSVAKYKLAYARWVCQVSHHHVSGTVWWISSLLCLTQNSSVCVLNASCRSLSMCNTYAKYAWWKKCFQQCFSMLCINSTIWNNNTQNSGKFSKTRFSGGEKKIQNSYILTKMGSNPSVHRKTTLKTTLKLEQYNSFLQTMKQDTFSHMTHVLH